MKHDNLFESIFFSPRSLQYPNGWIGHLPFAAWVIQNIAPGIFVELGTHSGNSYFSFCQAVVEAGLSTRCYAVDTWQGDEHAGQYDDEIFVKVNEYHLNHYAEFSRLLRMTFDDASTYFSNESIGLLHIDGMHTYEAVRHDFETWLPKLAPGAVVMFHDTNVRERNFGVWKFWEELQEQYPSNLEFQHSNGLGVLQLNNTPDDRKLEWLKPHSDERQNLIKTFAALGSRQLDRFDLAELKKELANLKLVVADRDSRVVNLTQVLAERDSALAECKQHSENLRQHTDNLDNIVAERDSLLAEYKQHANNLNDVIAAHESEISSLKRSLMETQGQHNNLAARLKNEEARITEILTSKSWRFTEPLRSFRRVLSRKTQQQSDGIAAEGSLAAANTPRIDDFDAEFYSKAYPDIYPQDPYAHYLTYGKNEGRLPCAPRFFSEIGALGKLDRSKETVLIVSHEASRSGAPILALNIAEHLRDTYNVVALSLRGGELLLDFQDNCDILISPFPEAYNQFVVSAVLGKLLPRLRIKFAIVNSIVSRAVLPVLAHCSVPSLCLVHEFASYTYPKNAIRGVLLWAGQVVFSARIVYENNVAQCAQLTKSNASILPQGRCAVPARRDEMLNTGRIQQIRNMLRPDSLPGNTVIILGAGAVHLRKGVDLFLACAARVVELQPENPFRFIWVGQGFDPDADMVYSVYLQDQISRSSLDSHVAFVGEIAEIDLVYEFSDILFLSSRLDPLPNVAIDAMFKELAVVCFDNTTGIADILKENGLGEPCVVPYLDIEKAAHCLVALIDDTDKRKSLAKESKHLAEKLFDMKSYVKSLEQRALDCAAIQEAEKIDCQAIEKEEALSLDYFSPPSWPNMSYKEAVRVYVRMWQSGIDLRKPFPGFHPGIYKELHGVVSGRNPLVDFIAVGKPQGLWLCDTIQPPLIAKTSYKLPSRVALHIHVFFADLFVDILQRLEAQDLHLDLLISVPSMEVAELVRTRLSNYKSGKVDIRVVPNRGRDIGPLLTEFNDTLLANYDIVGHVHTKKSGDVKDSTMGKSWYKFLLENLIGGEYPMAAIILEHMEENEKLGLVYPDDPNVIGWSANKQIAEDLASQLDIATLPGEFFNFPIGTMFWARTAALQPILSKGFTWEDYPEEPLPYDGTALHALERLFPIVAKQAGFQEMVTYVPGITR